MYMHHILNIIYKVLKKFIANTYVRFYVHRVNYTIYQGTFKRRKINFLKGCAKYNLVLSVTFYKMFSIMHFFSKILKQINCNRKKLFNIFLMLKSLKQF